MAADEMFVDRAIKAIQEARAVVATFGNVEAAEAVEASVDRAIKAIEEARDAIKAARARAD